VERIGPVLARLIVEQLVDAAAPIVAVVDDTLFRRWGPKVFGAFWTHDGSGQDPTALGRGNRWVIAGILVRLPFCVHPVCLPVLLRLWRGRGTASPVLLARELILFLAQEFPDRCIHAVGDAAYHGKALVAERTAWTPATSPRASRYRPADGTPRTTRVCVATTSTANGTRRSYHNAAMTHRKPACYLLTDSNRRSLTRSAAHEYRRFRIRRVHQQPAA
jgi:hypothetical protein